MELFVTLQLWMFGYDEAVYPLLNDSTNSLDMN